jgi:hypothetical protein
MDVKGGRRIVAALVGVLAAGVLAYPALGQDAESVEPENQLITQQGYGPVRIGASVQYLHRHHLINILESGCPGHPKQRFALLRRPMRGYVYFEDPKKGVAAVIVNRYVKTKAGIQIGSTGLEVVEAYPHYSTIKTGVDGKTPGYIWVPNLQHSKLTFTIDAMTNQVSQISAPFQYSCL